jgi:hypothetical protein
VFCVPRKKGMQNTGFPFQLFSHCASNLFVL